MKRAVQSRSLWFYTLTLITTVGTALLADENFKDLIGNNVGYVTGAMAVVGIWLRLISTTQIVSKKNLEILDETDWDEE